MTKALSRRESMLEPFDLLDRLDRWFGDWSHLPFRSLVGDQVERMLRVDEYHEDGTLVIKAEMPGIDPERDVELTVSEGMLHISAERREEEKTEKRGYVRQELRYGKFERTLPLMEGVKESDIKASYRDGILEIRIPAAEVPEPKRIPVTKQ